MAKRTYEVVGPLVTLGHAPGSTFAAELDPLAEKRMVDRGSIRVAKATSSGSSDKPTGKKE